MIAKNDNSRTVKRTDPLLLKVQPILASYTRATGAVICTVDQTYLAIPEIFHEITTEKNTCLYCMKYIQQFTIKKNQDFLRHPCRELHINGMKRAVETGGTYSYLCNLGFIFWASPVYADRNLIGTIIGSGFREAGKEKTAQMMKNLGYSPEISQNLMKRVSLFPQADPRHISAMAELMLVCAESFSLDPGEHYKTLIRRGKQQKELNALIEKMKGKGPVNAFAPEHLLDMEEAVFEAVRRGDAKKGSLLLNEILAILLFTYPRQFHRIQCRILELAILLGRTENTFCGVCNSFSATTLQFLKTIEEADTPEELVDAIHLMTRHLAYEAYSFQGIRHCTAIKKADRFIRANFARKIGLEEIAKASGLSAPYFSTIFKEEMGENLSYYLNRLRIEKASRLLSETNLPLTKIAGACGFEDQSWFSKTYKSFTGMNPGKYRQTKKNAVMELPKNKLSEEYQALLDKRT